MRTLYAAVASTGWVGDARLNICPIFSVRFSAAFTIPERNLAGLITVGIVILIALFLPAALAEKEHRRNSQRAGLCVTTRQQNAAALKSQNWKRAEIPHLPLRGGPKGWQLVSNSG